MNPTIRLALFFACVACKRAHVAQIETPIPNPVALDTVFEGTYSLYSHEKMPPDLRRKMLYMQSTILELKKDHYRYWFSSDRKSSDEPQYPVDGLYTAKAGTITMDIQIGSHQDSDSKEVSPIYLTYQWKTMKYDGQITLWPQEDLESASERPIPHNVLVHTKRSAEEIWVQENGGK